MAADTLPPWPPPSTRASPSLPALPLLLPPERQDRLFSCTLFVLPSNIFMIYQHPHMAYIHQVGHLRLWWRLEVVHTQSASLWLPGKLSASIQPLTHHNKQYISVGIKHIIHPNGLLFLIHQGHILGRERPRLTTGQVSQRDLC